jgi:hypothetical protein
MARLAQMAGKAWALQRVPERAGRGKFGSDYQVFEHM